MEFKLLIKSEILIILLYKLYNICYEYHIKYKYHKHHLHLIASVIETLKCSIKDVRTVIGTVDFRFKTRDSSFNYKTS